MAIAVARPEAASTGRGGSRESRPRSRIDIVGVRRVLSSNCSSPRLRHRFDRRLPLDLPPGRGPAASFDKFGDGLFTATSGVFVPLVLVSDPHVRVRFGRLTWRDGNRWTSIDELVGA
jgi:hypothetical protein